jgi:hypothetical protein
MARGHINKMDEVKGDDECRYEIDYFRREINQSMHLKAMVGWTI